LMSAPAASARAHILAAALRPSIAFGEWIAARSEGVRNIMLRLQKLERNTKNTKKIGYPRTSASIARGTLHVPNRGCVELTITGNSLNLDW
jgi:hypothetical protein